MKKEVQWRLEPPGSAFQGWSPGTRGAGSGGFVDVSGYVLKSFTVWGTKPAVCIAMMSGGFLLLNASTANFPALR